MTVAQNKSSGRYLWRINGVSCHPNHERGTPIDVTITPFINRSKGIHFYIDTITSVTIGNSHRKWATVVTVVKYMP